MLSRRHFVLASALAASNAGLTSPARAQPVAAGRTAATPFIRCTLDGRPAIGQLQGNHIAIWSSPTLHAALRGEGQATGKTVSLADTPLLPNVDPGAKILCMALNYVNHAVEAKQPLPEAPLLFFKSQEAMLAATDPIKTPALTQKLDYEGELMVTIGKDAWNIAADDAWPYIAGVAAFNDTTARDLQNVKAGQQVHLDWFSAKSLDRTTPIGPVVPVGAIIDDLKARRTRVITRVNGEERQNAPIADMLFDIPTIVSHISRRVRLSAGDVIATGTPPGVGFASNRFLKPGDKVEIEASGLPVLSSIIA